MVCHAEDRRRFRGMDNRACGNNIVREIEPIRVWGKSLRQSTAACSAEESRSYTVDDRTGDRALGMVHRDSIACRWCADRWLATGYPADRCSDDRFGSQHSELGARRFRNGCVGRAATRTALVPKPEGSNSFGMQRQVQLVGGRRRRREITASGLSVECYMGNHLQVAAV